MAEHTGVRHFCWDKMEKEPVTDVISRRVISGDRAMLAQIYLEKGAVVPLHSHENEQITYLLEGVLKFWLGEEKEELILRAGEVLLNGDDRGDFLEAQDVVLCDLPGGLVEPAQRHATDECDGREDHEHADGGVHADTSLTFGRIRSSRGLTTFISTAPKSPCRSFIVVGRRPLRPSAFNRLRLRR